MSTIRKKPKLEEVIEVEKEDETIQEEALLALIEHRTKEVETLRKQVAYYQSELDGAEKRLDDTHSQLAHLREQQKQNVALSSVHVKVERRSSSPVHINGGSRSQALSRPKLVIPSVRPRIFQPPKSTFSTLNSQIVSGVEANPSTASHNATRIKDDNSATHSSAQNVVRTEVREAKRKSEQKEHKELKHLIGKESSAHPIHCHASTYVPGQHRRRIRNLALCPVNNELFITSALDGNIRLWEIQSRGSSSSALSLCHENCLTPGQRWPEDLTWHPNGDSVFSTYTADTGDSQISILTLNKNGKASVSFLEDKPHERGVINSIRFMPWDDTCFVTGGSDHAVVLWKEKETGNAWNPTALHQKKLHTSSVTGIAGLQQKKIVLSVGADKRIIGFDVDARSEYFTHQIDSRCLSALPNPCDSNLFVVQAGTHGRQLRLFDIRCQQALHEFGWKPESSETVSALINQAWSPDGFCITSGSSDPVIYIFDIRYISQKPSQSIRAHQKRVFKAEWHPSFPLLISISSDTNIGFHQINKS